MRGGAFAASGPSAETLPEPAGPHADADPGPDGAPATDFRRRATLGVALIALVLLAPFAVASLLRREWMLASGTAGILLLLGVNALCVLRGRRHQEITLYGLVPGGMLFMTQLIAGQPIIGVLWCYPSVLGCYCMLDQRRAWIGNAMVLVAALPATWLAMAPDIAARVTATLLAVSAFAALLVHVIDDQRARLRSQIVTDALTGLYNRLPLASVLERAVEAHRAHGTPASLLALDLDHFKRVNDEGGHDAGDAVLRRVGAMLAERVAGGGLAFRLGGEEFLLLLPGIDQDAALAEARALCATFRDEPVLAERATTASVGVASLFGGETRTEWLGRADALLYVAKRGGRDRAVGQAEPAVGPGEPAAGEGPPG